MLPAGTTVELEIDVQERDRYGRLLAYVYTNGKSVQKALLAEGLARVVVHPPNVKYVEEYRAIEAVAKEQKRGIWADDPCADKKDGSNKDGKDGTKPGDDQKDDGNKGTDDNLIEQPKSGGGNGQNGGKLPKTATPYPTYALLGVGIIAAGAGLLLYRRRAA